MLTVGNKVLRAFHDFIVEAHCLYYPVHRSDGTFNYLMRSGPCLEPAQIEKWINDTEHGLVHGLMTAFLGRKKVEPIQTYEHHICSSLFHDFLKCVGRPEDHDRNLKEYFSNFDDYVYTHTDPTDIDKPLIVGDRLELLRYSDWKNWVVPSMLPDHDEQFMLFVHRYLRPALIEFLTGLQHVWVRHSPEYHPETSCTCDIGSRYHGFGKRVDKDKKFYPFCYWGTYKDCWPVEVGYLTKHHDISKLVPTSNGLVGLMKYDRIKTFSDYPRAFNARDHYSIRGDIPISEWVFTSPRDWANVWEYLENCKGFLLSETLFFLIDWVRAVLSGLYTLRT